MIKKVLIVSGTTLLLASCTQLSLGGSVATKVNEKANEACVELDRTKCVERTNQAGWIIEAIVDINDTLLETIVEDSGLTD